MNKNENIENDLNKEIEQLNLFRESWTPERCAFIPQDTQNEKMLRLVIDRTGWVDNSSKSAPPPDFLNKNTKVMLEAMMVDDHETRGNRKDTFNPLKANESRLLKEHEDELAEILNRAGKDAKIYVNAVTDLPTDEDHSYEKYLSSFTRIVEKHARQSEKYRQNHPDLTLIFFVFDESSRYYEAIEQPSDIKEGLKVRGKPHFFFADKAFLDVIKRSGADYFIWYAPWKQSHLFFQKPKLPDTAIYRIKDINIPERRYRISNMLSAEV